jgi:hypothetical protein
MGSTHELRFESLFRPGRGLAFPCDERGRVDIDAFSERLRSSYFFARGMIGHEYATPRVVRRSATPRREAAAPA